jgi:hypothetical protein
MSEADEHPVADVGRAALRPGLKVVHINDAPLTAWEAADTSVADQDRPPLGRAPLASLAAEGERLVVRADQVLDGSVIAEESTCLPFGNG